MVSCGVCRIIVATPGNLHKCSSLLSVDQLAGYKFTIVAQGSLHKFSSLLSVNKLVGIYSKILPPDGRMLG